MGAARPIRRHWACRRRLARYPGTDLGDAEQVVQPPQGTAWLKPITDDSVYFFPGLPVRSVNPPMDVPPHVTEQIAFTFIRDSCQSLTHDGLVELLAIFPSIEM